MKLMFEAAILICVCMCVAVSAQSCASKPGVWSALSLSDQAGASSDCHFLGVVTNPVKPCSSCAACANNLASKVIRVSGDWSVDAGSPKLWDGAEPLGLMTFDEQTCSYTLVVSGLKKNFSYKWKVTTNNMWVENYGCGGSGDCLFTSSPEGAIRFIVKATTGAPQLTSDLLIDPSIIPINPVTSGPSNPITANPSVTNPIPTADSNPVKPCTANSCPTCINNLASKVVVYLLF